MTPAAPPPRPVGEEGFVLVWFAVVILVLLGVAALAVDVLVGYSMAQKVQNAADAGALAGVQLLPDDPAGARDEARAVVKRNVAVPDAAISFAPRPLPTQLEVEVRARVETFFGKVFGIDSIGVTRRAVAEYDPPVVMGSPFSTFGNTPGTGPAQPWYWATVAGPLTVKGAGDAALSDWCDEPRSDPSSFEWLGGTNQPVDSCPAGAANPDHEAAQYFVIDKRGGGELRVDLFDPAYVDTWGGGPHPACGHAALAQVWADAGYPARLDPAADEYCAGDQYVRFRGWEDPWYRDPAAADDIATAEARMDAAGLANDTTYVLYPPDATPSNPYDNEVNAAPVCGPRTYEGHFNALLARDAAADGTFATLHDWTPLCPAGGPSAPGRYVLRVSTAPGTHGLNRFAIRAYAGGSAFSDPSVTVGAVDRMAVYTNRSASSGEFFLARVPPSSVDRVLTVTLFDTGDLRDLTAGESMSLQVLRQPGPARPPAAPPVPMDGCRYTPPPGESGPRPAPWRPGATPWGGPVATAAGCTIAGVTRAGYNGQYVTVEVPIPAAPAYTCDATRADECWLKLRFDTAGLVVDTSTWVATLSGEPVRIVE